MNIFKNVLNRTKEVAKEPEISYITYKELKEKLKTLAKEIKDMKGQRKQVPNGYVAGLDSARYRFRHHHIAYCMLRGRTRDEIERPADYNRPNETYISEIMATVKPREEANEKVICCS